MRFRKIYDGQLMVTGRTMWGPKVPTLKGTETSLSYVQCFLYLVSSSINVFIFHITRLDTFWTDHTYIFSIFMIVPYCFLFLGVDHPKSSLLSAAFIPLFILFYLLFYLLFYPLSLWQSPYCCLWVFLFVCLFLLFFLNSFTFFT